MTGGIRKDKGWFGYKYVHFHLVVNSSGDEGWVGECSSPGRDECRVGVAGIQDQNEVNAVNALIQFADKAIDSRNFSGTEAMRISVEGESTDRIYRVIWNTNEDGDGTINIERDEI